MSVLRWEDLTDEERAGFLTVLIDEIRGIASDSDDPERWARINRSAIRALRRVRPTRLMGSPRFVSAPVLRCWARRERDGALCVSHEHHGAAHLSASDVGDGLDGWGEGACAPGAGADGRETAALRILELSHELDRLAFPGEALFSADVRRLAAVLHEHDAPDLREALEDFEEAIASDAEFLACEGVVADDEHAVLLQVVERLRPWAAL